MTPYHLLWGWFISVYGSGKSGDLHKGGEGFPLQFPFFLFSVISQRSCLFFTSHHEIYLYRQTVYIFPSDQDTEPIVTSRPDGSPLVLKIRDIELENIEKLKSMEGIHVISDFSEIKSLILEKYNKTIKK